jgi:acyl carrier protein
MHTTRAEIIDHVRGFIAENFLYMRPDVELHADDHLIDRGIVDSLGVVEMVTFLEDTYAIHTADDEISVANLGSLDAIADFVSRKRAMLAA